MVSQRSLARVASSTSICMIRSVRYEYMVPRAVRKACWYRYDVKERNVLNGADWPFSNGGIVRKWWQNSLLAMMKSYRVRNMADSSPGLQGFSQSHNLKGIEHTAQGRVLSALPQLDLVLPAWLRPETPAQHTIKSHRDSSLWECRPVLPRTAREVRCTSSGQIR